MAHKKKFIPKRTKCAICGEVAPSGSIHCPAVDGQLVCHLHCYQCSCNFKMPGWWSCTYKRRPELYGNRNNIELQVGRLKDKTTDELSEMWKMLYKKYKRHLLYLPEVREQLIAIRGILFRRQFEVTKYRRVVKQIPGLDVWVEEIQKV